MKKIEDLKYGVLCDKIIEEFNAISENGAAIIFIGPVSAPYSQNGTVTQRVLVFMGLYDNETGEPYSQKWVMFWDTGKVEFNTLAPIGGRDYDCED